MANLYASLSKLGILKKKYSAKFLFVAFIGTHIPLIIIVALTVTHIFSFNTTFVLLSALLATLLAAIVTLYALNKLLWPLHLAKNALSKYLIDKQVPQLPVHFNDEAGILLKELQETIEQLDYLIGEKKDVITLLSHDIRTPFNQILAFSGLIQQESNKDAINLHAQAIREITIRNLMILNDILKLLKTDHAEQIDNEETDIAEIIEECCESLLPTAQAKPVEFIITKDVQVNKICINQCLLKEAVNNILQNAIKFSYPNSRIEISIRKKQSLVHVAIKDHGIGITEADKTKIFNRFTSAGRKGTSGEYSSGVGLYLSKKIITKSNGQLTVSSAGKNQGATFVIILPVVQ